LVHHLSLPEVFMRLPLVTAILLSLALAAPAQAAADRLTAGELMRMCSSEHDVDYGYCAGYITAVADQMLAAGTAAGQRACNHEGIRSQQYVDVFRSYAEIFPERMKDEAKSTVAASFARAFPCR
jgi:hypothetical protein